MHHNIVLDRSSLSLVDLAATRAIDQSDIEEDSKEEEEFVSFSNANDEYGGEHREEYCCMP